MDKLSNENIDYPLIWVVISLVIIGIVSVYSATYDAGASGYFHRQIIWLIIGFFLVIFLILLPLRTLQLFSFPVYIVSVLVLLAVLVLGKTISGSKSWFGIYGFGLQPSEIVKITTILAVASFLSSSNVSLNRMKDIIKVFCIGLLPVALILMQPDIGTAIVYVGSLFLILYWSGAKNFLMLALIAPPAVAIAALIGTPAFLIVILLTLIAIFLLKENLLLSSMVFSFTVIVGVSIQFVFSKLAPYQQKRILTFLNPDVDPLGAGYNVIQSKIAIGSGGILGKGFLQGTQTQLNFIPAQWTDFIYCVPSEEFGFIGAFLILVLFVILLLRGVKIASMVKSRYASIVAIGITSFLLVHILINIGMVMGIMPVIGVPLPFLSYGGSNLLTNMVMIGLMLNMYANRKEY